MNIGERLNRYLARIGCTAKELAAAAGVSEVQLSRWRTGKQTPSAEQAALLAAGIVALLPEADEESVRDALIASLAESAVDSDRIIRNLNDNDRCHNCHLLLVTYIRVGSLHPSI